MKHTNASQIAKAAPELPCSAPFPYRDFMEARAAIEDAARAGFFYGALTGPTGTGKTTLMRELRQGLDRHRHHVVYLLASNVSLLGLIRYFAESIHVTPRRSSLETSRLITQAIRGQTAHILAWIDEAHRLPPATLAEIASLAEFDPEAPQVFSVVFSGPPELSAVLDDRRLAALRRRITVKCSLAGLRRDELEPFLSHRFGGAESRLPTHLMDELFERTRGAPAIIDAVVRTAMRRAGSDDVSEAVLRGVLDAQG